MYIIDIARMCHENNRLFCLAHGDSTHLPWDESNEVMVNFASDAVKRIIDDPTMDGEKVHNLWMELKLRDGWVYGEVKDVDKKTHPCLVPYKELSYMEQAKDRMFREIVLSCAPLVED